MSQGLTAKNLNLDSILIINDLRLRCPAAAGSLSFTMDLMRGLSKLLPASIDWSHAIGFCDTDQEVSCPGQLY